MAISKVIILFKNMIPCYHLTTKIEQRDIGGGREEREIEREREREQEKETSSLTLHFTNFLATLMVASQKAPLYLALTSVPTVRNGGSSEVAYNMFITRRVLSLFQPTPANCISTKVHSQPTPKIQYTLYKNNMVGLDLRLVARFEQVSPTLLEPFQ